MCDSGPAPNVSGDGHAPHGAGGSRVLLVEDDPDHRLIAEHFLGKLPDRVREITVVESFLGMQTALDKKATDVVLLDLTLPDSPMAETLKALRPLTERYDARFIVMSSLSSEDVARAAIENSGHAFLSKQSFSAETLREILDEVHPVPGVSVEPPRSASVENPQPTRPDAIPSSALDPRALATKIAHDSLSWVANISFRAAHMEADPAVQSSAELQADVASMQTSVSALTSYIEGARSAYLGELAGRHCTGLDPVTLELGAWLPQAVNRWKRTSRDKRLTIEVAATSTVRLSGEHASQLLAQCFAALLQNVRLHAQRKEGPITVHVREEPSEGANTALVITDDGGPWQVHDASLLGSPLATGTQNAASAGLGLFNARRAVESLGCALTIFERSDAPGAYGIRLTMPKA